MRAWLKTIASTAAIGVLFATAPATAAVLRSAAVGCKADGDAAKLLALAAKNDPSGVNKFTQPKIATGECMTLARSMTVTPDIKRPALICVRPNGGLDCFWVSSALVDLDPPPSAASPFAGGGRRSGRR